MTNEEKVAHATEFTLQKNYPRIAVELRSEGKWAVVSDGRSVLNSDMEWEFEPMPSHRDDAFIARTRFDLDTAWLLAQKSSETE